MAVNIRSTIAPKAADRKAVSVFALTVAATFILPAGIAALVTATTAPVAFVEGVL